MLKKSKLVDEEHTAPVFSPISAEEKTIIGENISIIGDIQGKEDLIIEGSVKGKLELEKHHLTVGSKGHVEGEIHANSVTIGGRLIGNIYALGKVAITKEADFNGEIKAKYISVEDGAYLKAVIELEREPQKKAVPAVRAAAGAGKEPLTLASEVDKR